MKRFGWTNPVLVDEDDVVLAGYGRVEAARRLGLSDAPVIVARGWSDAEKRAYMLADNQIALQAGWDEELLKLELDDLKLMDFDLTLIGFPDHELRQMEKTGTLQPRIGNLKDDFILPPFSILDARTGWWQDRKRAWLALGIKSEIGRGENALRYSDTILQPDRSKRAQTPSLKGGLTHGLTMDAYRKRGEPLGQKLILQKPEIVEHEGVLVVRDDLYPGGTKARFISELFDHHDEIVYASPCEGGAQTALAICAEQKGKRATIFCAERAARHPRTALAAAHGARIEECKPGYLSVCRSRAAAYAAAQRAFLAPFGFDIPEAQTAIAGAAIALGLQPEEIWCAAGSGVLARALRAAWPFARLCIVQVGHAIDEPLRGLLRAEIIIAPWRFEQACPESPPFPSDRNYDAKAWACMMRKPARPGRLFWNVTGPA